MQLFLSVPMLLLFVLPVRVLSYLPSSQTKARVSLEESLSSRFLTTRFSSSLNSEASQRSSSTRSEVHVMRKISVCTDLACEQQGAYETLDALRAAVRQDPCGISSVGEMGCPGRCGSGPIVEIENEAGELDTVEGASTTEVIYGILHGGCRGPQ
mmetsp:Transcript_29221/g.49258  ORF Transcript_29221/g.49258 Transcript_29221/m.49258 type:complete len:155 (+) Transcript_29221:75-539(+)